MEAGGPTGAGDLAVAVEARDGRAAGVSTDQRGLTLEPLVAEHEPARGAVECEQDERVTAVERVDRLAARSARRVEDRLEVALEEPDDAALRNLGDHVQRAVLEVRAGDVARALLRAAPAEPERMRHAELRERRRVGTRLLGRVEALEVDVERRPVVERVDAV